MSDSTAPELKQEGAPKDDAHNSALSNVTYEFFSDTQKYYLDLLAKYSGRRQKLNIINQGTMFLKKENIIKQNFGYLSINEQVGYNDVRIRMNKTINESYIIGGTCMIASYIYYLLKTPLAKSMTKEKIMCVAFGLLGGFAYYKLQ